METYIHVIPHQGGKLTFIKNFRFLADIARILGASSRLELLKKLEDLHGDIGKMADAIDAAFTSNGYTPDIAQEIGAEQAEMLVLELLLDGKALIIDKQIREAKSNPAKKPRNQKTVA